MQLDANNNLIAPLLVIDTDGTTVGEALNATTALELLELAWSLGGGTIRRPTRIELGEWKGKLCWCDVRLNYGSVLPFLKIAK